MQNFLWMLIFAGLVWANEGTYAIQVLSVQDKKAVTEDFRKRAETAGLPYLQKHVRDRYKVFLGEFKTHAEALSQLTSIRERVNKDAFIVRMEEEPSMNPQLKMQQAIVMAQAKSLQRPEQKAVSAEIKAIEVPNPVPAVSAPEKKLVIVRQEAKPLAKMKEKTKETELYCKPSKKALRESEISDAIAFYRHSSYYTFIK